MPTVDYEPKLEREVERIEQSNRLGEEDRDLLLDYRRDMEVEGLSSSRIFKVLCHTRKMAERLGGGLAEATKEDLKDLVAWIQRRDLADSTKRDYREILKRFYKWLNGGDYPEKAEWIDTTRKKGNEKIPEKLLDEGDIERLVDAARHPRNESLLSLMWETGGRPGEYLDLRVGDIEDREKGKKVVIDGKTGMRRLPLVSSVPHLNAWLSQHPAGGDPEAPLWCRLDDHPYERIDYDYFRKLLREIAERAGVDKPIYPYQFRHSRATYLANHLTEAQMCEYFGWVQGSDRPATYVHLSGRDIDVTYNKIHGLEEEEADRPDLSPEECPRCGEMNSPGVNFCSRCGLPLGRDAAQRLQEDREISEALYSEEAEAEGGIEELVNEMVEKRLMKILGKDSKV